MELEFLAGRVPGGFLDENWAPICSPGEPRVLCFKQQAVPVFFSALRGSTDPKVLEAPIRESHYE
jgi:hypothetical protein